MSDYINKFILPLFSLSLLSDSTGSKIDAGMIDSACSSSNDDPVDVYCHDYDPFNGISESKGGQLLLSFTTILVGTVILSAFGL